MKYIDAYCRRCNLIIDEVEEYRGENCGEIVSDIFARHMGIYNAKAGLDKTHRVGRIGNMPGGRSPAIVLRST